MANKRWRGDAKNVAQLNTITPTAQNAETYSVTINGKNISFLSDASATVAEITAGLVAALTASTVPPEFQEITWADTTTTVTATAVTPGKPFTQTSSATGIATLVTVITTANKSSNDWNDADNWDPTGVPVSTDDVFIENSSVSILFGLAQSAVTLTSLNIASSFTGDIGLPKYTGLYYEYRADYLAIGATTLNVGSGPGNGSTRLKINTGSVQTTINCFGTAAGAESGLEAFLWKGTHASNVVEISRGSMGVAVFGGETAVIATLRCGYQSNVASDVSMRCGIGMTLSTIQKSGGDLTIQSNSTTINHVDGTLTILLGIVTTLNLDGGTVYYQSTGTITTLNVGNDATIDFSRDMSTRTVTTTNLHAGSTLNDPFATVILTNGFKTPRCTLQEVTVNLGNDRTYTPS